VTVLDATPATPPENIARQTITVEPEVGMGGDAKSEPSNCYVHVLMSL